MSESIVNNSVINIHFLSFNPSAGDVEKKVQNHPIKDLTFPHTLFMCNLSKKERERIRIPAVRILEWKV